MLSELCVDVIVCLKNLILNANSRISHFKVVRYRFWSALSKKLMVGLYDFFECYWTATAISTRKYPVPFDPGSQAGKSPPSTAVRENVGIPGCCSFFDHFWSYFLPIFHFCSQITRKLDGFESPEGI